MKNTIITLAYVTMLAGSATAQSIYDFSGSQTAIISGGNTIGYRFGNIFGDGSDAILDVTIDPTNTSQYYGGGNFVDNQLTAANTPSIVITNGSSQANNTAGLATSLAIFMYADVTAPYSMGTSMNAKVLFKLRNAAGMELTSNNVIFATRDLDGNANPNGDPSAGRQLWESINVNSASNIQLDSPTSLSVASTLISASQNTPNNTNPSSDKSTTASWNHSAATWNWDLKVDLRDGTASFLGGKPSNGFIFDTIAQPIPEPSSTALLGLGALGLLIRRMR